MKALRFKPKYKVYYRYQNIKLWRKLNLMNLHHKKWTSLKLIEQQYANTKNLRIIRPIYLCHSRKLNVERLYFYKFLNKQILRNYLVNYNEFSFSQILRTNYLKFECRLDFNLYKAGFVTSLYEARFFITHGYIFVNNHHITNINFILNTNDLVKIDEKVWMNLNKNLFTKLTYIRNLEIDYKTGSFIFFNYKNFFILNFNNFVKEIYIHSKYQHNNWSNRKTNIITFQNTSFINNYFLFFESVFNYYLFVNKMTHVLNKRKYFSINSNTIEYLMKYLRLYFNDYYFRNILLKRVFQTKYTYLQILSKTTDKLDTFQYIFNNFKLTTSKNSLNQDFFKYYYNLLFKFYIYMIKNYYVNQLNFKFNASVNHYNTSVFVMYDIFKLLNIKNKLFNFYQISNNKNLNFGYCDLVGTNKYKLIDMSVIKQVKNKQTRYIQPFQFSLLTYYISSNVFKYKLYTKCRSFYQNNKRRYNAIKKLRRSFLFQYYNKIRFGISTRVFTSNQMYNQCLRLSQNVQKIKTNTRINNLYYPTTSKLYNLIYTPSIINTTDIIKNLNDLIQNIKHLNSNKITDDLINTLNIFSLQLKDKLQFFETNRMFTNFNCNTFYKNIYLLNNLVKNFNTFKLIDYNLKSNNYNTLYKIHLCNNYLNIRFAERYATKRSHRFLSYYSQRAKLNYYYINHMKTKCFLPTNIASYFNNNSLKQNFNFLFNYYHYRKGRSKYFYNYKLNLLKSNVRKIKKVQNFNCNLNIITNYNFNDTLFLIDLILNISARRLNSTYNLINTKVSKKIDCDSLQINKNIRRIKLKNNKHKLVIKSIKSYKYNNYLVHFYTKITKKLNTKSSIYYYNLNNYNNFTMLHLYKLYFTNYSVFKLYNNCYIYKNFKITSNIQHTYYNTYLYFMYNIRKYRLIKYVFKNYIFKEYDVFLNNLITLKNIKQFDSLYIKNLYYNLMFSKLYNLDFYDFIFKNNFIYSHNLKIMINYFILIKRFYR